jgi:hypothetical protein
VLEETKKEITGRELESSLEKGREHHDLFGIGCRDVLPYSRPPLKHSSIREKVILD